MGGTPTNDGGIYAKEVRDALVVPKQTSFSVIPQAKVTATQVVTKNTSNPQIVILNIQKNQSNQ